MGVACVWRGGEVEGGNRVGEKGVCVREVGGWKVGMGGGVSKRCVV